MNLSIETSSHKNNTSTIQTRTTQKLKQTHNEKTKHQHKYLRKWSSKHETWGEDMRTYTFLLKIWRWKSAKMEFVESDMECLGEFQLREKWGRQWTVTKSWGKNWKSFKNCFRNAEHAFFATKVSRQQVARSSRQNTQRQNHEKFSKCFSRLEGLPTRESRAELRKSLCTPHDWTFHSRTSCQN